MRKIAALCALCTILLVSSALADKLLPIKRTEIVESVDKDAGKPSVFFGRAKENFLQLDRDKAYGLPKAALAADEVDTVHIIAFRVAFAYETTDDPTTTGRGTFDNRDSATFVNQEGHWLDPAPHNKHYFESHLRALNQYYEVVSNGRLHLEYEVWPQGGDTDTGYYQLSKSMAYYGEQPPSYGLAGFFHDGLNTAYAADGGSFSFTDANGNKKAILLFHAGADRQTDLSFSATPTPNDLFTGFTTYDGDSRVFLGADTITEGIIMPETMAQDNRVTVLNAVLAHEFGHQLGLIDLYNTGSSPFLSQMGDFALMDNNGMNTAAYIDEFGLGAFGTVPLYPIAWSRAYLGFDDVVEYREGTSIELAAVKMENDGVKIAKIPISATEYYLIENRRGDLDGELEGLKVDSVSNVVLWPAKRQIVIDSSGHIDTITVPVREYDVYLPDNASGLAIWHVDEAVAAMDYFPFDLSPNNFEGNTLQWDPNRRFVTLVEADGIIDFGGNYVRGFGSGKDLFYGGNNTTFASYTNPPTLSNDGGYTHYSISNISGPGLTMTFDLSRDRFAENFPRRTSIPARPDFSPVAADLNNDGIDEILTISNDKILAVSATGVDFMDPTGALDDYDTIFSAIDINTDGHISRPTDTTYARLPVFSQILAGTITTEPVVVRFIDTLLVFVGASNGWIYSYLPYSTGSTSPTMYRATLRPILSGPVANIPATAIFPDYTQGLVHVLYADGNFISAPWDSSGTINNIVHTFDGDYIGHCAWGGGLALLFQHADETALYMTRSASFANLADSLVADSVIFDETDFYSPVATDFNRDGIDEVVLLSADGRADVYSFTPTGIEEYASFAVDIGDTATASPVVCDYTDNGYPDVFISGTNRIYGFDRNGLTLADFPLDVDFGRSGQLIVTSPLVSDVNGDSRLDFSVISFDSIPRSRSVLAYYVDYPDTINYPDSFVVVDTVIDYAYYNYYSNLYVVSPGIKKMAGYPVPAGIFGMRSLDDVIIGIGSPVHAKNGAEGILVTSGANGWMDAWDCSWSADKALWTMGGRTPDQAAYVPVDALGDQAPLAELLPESRFYNYPNPATGEATTIRFYVNQPSTIRIAIFDALGDVVKEFSREVPVGDRDEEIVWNLSGVASGVYHCRLEASSSDGSSSKIAFKTIAVIK